MLRRVDQAFGLTVNKLTVENLRIEIVKQVCWCANINDSAEEDVMDEEVYGIVWYTQPSHYHPSNYPATCMKVNMVVDEGGYLSIGGRRIQVAGSTVTTRKPIFQRRGQGDLTFWTIYLSFEINKGKHDEKYCFRDVILFKIMKELAERQEKAIERSFMKRNDLNEILERLRNTNEIDLMCLFKDENQMKENIKSIKKKMRGYSEDSEKSRGHSSTRKTLFSGEKCKHYLLVRKLEELSDCLFFCDNRKDNLKHWEVVSGRKRKNSKLIDEIMQKGLSKDVIEYFYQLRRKTDKDTYVD